MQEAPRPLNTSFTEGAKNNTAFTESDSLTTSMATFNPNDAIYTEIIGEPEVQREIEPSDSLASFRWSKWNHPLSLRDLGWTSAFDDLWVVWDNSPVYVDVEAESVSDSLTEQIPKPPSKIWKEYTGTETEYTEV